MRILKIRKVGNSNVVSIPKEYEAAGFVADADVKIPATAEGVPAVQAMIAEGRSINITLLFSLERYDEVIEAYLSGLEACEGDLSHLCEDYGCARKGGLSPHSHENF